MKTAHDLPRFYQLYVSLSDTEPPIWRRLLVLDSTTLAALHDALQISMGWTDSHAHEFTKGKDAYGPPDPELPGSKDDRRVALAGLLEEPGDHMKYIYDLGDFWEHDIVLEEIGPVREGVSYPAVIGGDRACPPEDCGGTPGYADLLVALADRSHPQHAEIAAWVGRSFDPAVFDVAGVNKRIQQKSSPRMPERL